MGDAAPALAAFLDVPVEETWRILNRLVPLEQEEVQCIQRAFEERLPNHRERIEAALEAALDSPEETEGVTAWQRLQAREWCVVPGRTTPLLGWRRE